jgi:Carboxypeptidase regulatory-like domain/TonB dependent receptor
VTDPQGRRVTQVLVRVVQQATGLQRETRTTSDGSYLLDSLPIGIYSVTFTKSGFAPYTVDRVQEVVGHTRTLNARLVLPKGATQTTTITEPLVQLNKSDASVGAAIGRTEIQDLPLNGRNFANLTAFIPGAIDSGTSDERSIRFAGHGLDDNNITIDGVDATAIYNQEQRQYVRLSIPLESVGAFQAQSQNFGADMEGGTAGGQVSVATPSGSNAFHGDVFDFFRNNTLDSRSPFNGPSPDPFLLNQFGGNLGGPIKRNKLFFYVNYEGLRQRLGQSQIGLVPSPSFIAQVSAQSPVLTSILQAYPRGTSPLTATVWNYNVEANAVDNEDSGMARLDYHFSDRTTAFVRFNTDHAIAAVPTGALSVTSNADTNFRNGIVELLHVFTPSLLNEAKFGVNQQIYHTVNVSDSPFTVSVPGFSSLTGNSTTDDAAKTFSSLDDLTWVKGKHILKMGYEIRWVQLNQGDSASGTLTYLSPALFAANQLDSATYVTTLPLKRSRKAQYWGYIQDTYKVTPNLTLNLGVRYNFFNTFHEVDNRAIPFDFASCGPQGYCPRGSVFSFPRYNDVDPRVGVAWAHGDTVVRMGGGIYHSDGQEDDQNLLPISNDNLRYSLNAQSSPGLSYPLTNFLLAATGVVSPRLLDRNRKDMYVSAWTASVQQKLPGKIVATATYLGNKGTDLLTTTYVNVANPTTGVVPYPAFGVVAWRGNDSNSTFHGLQFNARREFQNGFLLSANYMWSHSINDGSIGGGESDTVQDVFCRACDKASSDDDVRQVLNVSAVYQLPFGAGRRFLTDPGIARFIFGGWQISSVATGRSGLPVNITVDRPGTAVPGGYAVPDSERPDLIPGVSLVPPGGQTPNNWINLAAFAVPADSTFGNLGRNAFRGPDLWQIDAALSKRVSITERLGMQFRAEVFNIFNRAQYGNPQADISNPLNFGQITTTVNQGATGNGTPRQIQLAVRVIF